MYGKIRVRIKGLTPLLMNRVTPEKLKAGSRVGTKEYDVQKDARESAYMAVIDGKEQLYLPAIAVYRMMIQASGLYRIGVGGRRISASSILAGTIRVEPEKIPLGQRDYEVDLRPVVIPPRARIIRARAKVPTWEATFDIIYDKTVIGDELVGTLREILEDGGRRVGLLDYRPQKKGWFGTFKVEEFKPE